MIGICQCRIVFLKTITTVPGNVNMSIEGNTSLNKPIFCKNKTKSKKKNKNHAQKTEIWAPPSSPLAMSGRKIHPSARGWRQKSTFIFSPITNYEAFNILVLNIHEMSWERQRGPWQKSKSSCSSRNQTLSYNGQKIALRINHPVLTSSILNLAIEKFRATPMNFCTTPEICLGHVCILPSANKNEGDDQIPAFGSRWL